MPYVATDADGREYIYEDKPQRGVRHDKVSIWINRIGDYIELPQGSILRLIGRPLTYSDEPVKLKKVKP